MPSNKPPHFQFKAVLYTITDRIPDVGCSMIVSYFPTRKVTEHEGTGPKATLGISLS